MRASFFIDGYNFYHSIAHVPHYKWMSYTTLCRAVLQRDHVLNDVFLFTALARHIPGDSWRRHKIIEKAWKSEGCKCIMGRFKPTTVRCRNCGPVPRYEEKESDVNLGIHLINEAHKGNMDVAYVVTNDSDLLPAIKMFTREFPSLELVLVTPMDANPCRALVGAADNHVKVDAALIEVSLYPRQVLDDAGKVVATRPFVYNPPYGHHLY